MTDKEKLNAIRAEVQNYIDAAHKAHTNITEGNFAHLLSFIDSLQEEPVSKELEKACKQLAEKARKHKAETISPFFSPTDYEQGVIDGVNWKEQKDSIISEDLEKVVNNYTLNVRKGYPRVMDETDRYICNAFKAGAKWQKEQMMEKAVEGGCFSYKNGFVHISCDIDERITNIKFGDKVKVIVIKES